MLHSLVNYYKLVITNVRKNILKFISVNGDLVHIKSKYILNT